VADVSSAGIDHPPCQFDYNFVDSYRRQGSRRHSILESTRDNRRRSIVSALLKLNQMNCCENSVSGCDTDRELLQRFLAGDEAAFSELVRRHTGLVSSVCQRVLRQSSDAEDAFQATFLILARKAKSLEWQDSIAGWLHQAARRTALKLRSTAVRRRNVEDQAARQHSAAADSSVTNPVSEVGIRELGEILDAELASLPLRFREVILLSQIEGLTRDEVAGRLGITVATVKDRLERGREQLRSRLLRRGVELTSAALAVWLVPATAQATSLMTLASATSHAATAFATGSLAAGTSPTAATVAQGVLNMMGFEKLKYATVWVVSFLTAGGIALGMLRDEPTRFEKGLRGQVVAVNAGKTSTVTISLEDFGTLLNLDVAAEAKVWTAFEAGQLAELKAGQFVSLRLADDHRTVNEIHIQGQVREASIKSVASSGKIVVVEDNDDEEGGGKPMEVELAPDAILRIGGLPAARSDLKPGMQVPLEFGRDGKLVHAVEAEAAENTVIDCELLEVDPIGNKLVFSREESDDGQPARQPFAISAEPIITLDGKPVKLADLKRGSWLTLRLSDEGHVVRAIRAVSPEVEDEKPETDEQ
jgi:RNA polymerase sigma factor (sigma-70 family)